MSITLNTRKELVDHLISLDFQRYGLDNGLDIFITKMAGNYGSTIFDNEPQFHNFDWKSEAGNDIQIKIAMMAKEIEDDQWKTWYVVDDYDLGN